MFNISLEIKNEKMLKAKINFTSSFIIWYCISNIILVPNRNLILDEDQPLPSS